MAKLVVNPASPAPYEIQLKPGTNLLGRGFANDFKIDDPSVSGSHCQIVVDFSGVLIKDLGSTNGTFVNRSPVREATLQPGQTVHLGGVEMVFQSEAPVAPGMAAPPPPPAPGIRAVPVTAVRIASTAAPAAAPAAPVILSPPAAPPAAHAPASTTGTHYCKFHPKSLARYLCTKCQRYFCEFCVTSRGQHRTCRHCGTECTPIEVTLTVAKPKKFYSQLPGAFIYPFKGSGLLVLIVATLVFAGLDVMSSRIGWGFLMTIIALGYVFSYMQNIIHATASEETEMPELPGMDDLFGGCFRLAGTVAISFGLPIIFLIMAFFGQTAVAPLILPTAILGTLYFPMAFLAVAMKDSLLAANPMVVFPAIFKVPLGYFVAAILVTAVLVLRQAGSMVTSAALSSSYTTRDMSVLFTAFGMRAFFSFANVYLLTVSMRILGLLYVSYKHKFGWFSR
jgi:hypothetical protein